jgi:ATP-dependent DNA helicase RecG
MRTTTGKEVQEQDATRVRLASALELEKRLDYRNSSVIGGFSNYARRAEGLPTCCPDGRLSPREPDLATRYGRDIAGTDRPQLLAELEKSFGSSLGGPFRDELPKKDEVQNSISLRSDVRYQKFVGAATAQKLEKLGVRTIGDLLHHFPHRYLDTSSLRKISELRTGEDATVIGIVRDVRKLRSKRGTRILNIGIFDGTAYLYGVWFNQNYIAETLKPGVKVAFSGKIVYRFKQLEIENPFYDVIDERTDIDEDTIHTNRIIPFHPATKNLSSSRIRRIIKHLTDTKSRVPDPLPTPLRMRMGLLSKSLSLKEIHFPTSQALCDEARKRLVFEELFLIQIGLALKKAHFKQQVKGIRHKVGNFLLDRFYSSLPFDLTPDQKKVISEIQDDMKQPEPMNRLLQGEVGSGKTIVALATLLTTVENGYQGAIMAPTEVLAEQHFHKIKAFLQGLDINVALLTGSQTPKEKQAIQSKIERGETDIIVGTHTLVQQGVIFKRLGAAVVDEQHRFGVAQRINLKEKGVYPDILVMTATPIPRTLALTLYGDLDVSIIKELPMGRKIGDHIKTHVCDQNHRDWAYKKISDEVRKGRQAYIVCPLIEESNKLEAKAAAEEAKRLKDLVFPDLKVALLHGKLKNAEKEQVMLDFRNGLTEILISTTVIEVGIDVPNASVMLIEDADRFGLAQLHQLRGRIGRGKHESCCILFADPNTEEGRARMEAIKDISDGFGLAEVDLEIRGEGQIFGTRQSGLPDLKLARLTRDFDLLLVAREEAFRISREDQWLRLPHHQGLLLDVKERFGDRLDWLFHS